MCTGQKHREGNRFKRIFRAKSLEQISLGEGADWSQRTRGPLIGGHLEDDRLILLIADVDERGHRRSQRSRPHLRLDGTQLNRLSLHELHSASWNFSV